MPAIDLRPLIESRYRENTAKLRLWHCEQVAANKDVLGESNSDTIAKLAALERVGDEHGIDLSPLKEYVDPFLEKYTGKHYGLQKGFKKLAEIVDSQIQEIPLEDRWKICGIAPETLDLLDKSPLGGELKKLRPLIFDNDKNPLHFKQMASAWRRFTARPLERTDIDFLSKVCAVCLNISSGEAGFSEGTMQMGMFYGKTLTDSGYKEIKSLWETQPDRYAFEHVFDGATPVDTPSSHETHLALASSEGQSARHYLVDGAYSFIRKNTNKETLVRDTNDFLDHYVELEQKFSNLYKKVPDDHPKYKAFIEYLDESRTMACGNVCRRQKLLHARPGAHTRVIEIFLLNRLLAEQGQSYTLMDNPKTIDGHSTNETYGNVRKGQRNFLALTSPEKSINASAALPATKLRSEDKEYFRKQIEARKDFISRLLRASDLPAKKRAMSYSDMVQDCVPELFRDECRKLLIEKLADFRTVANSDLNRGIYRLYEALLKTASLEKRVPTFEALLDEADKYCDSAVWQYLALAKNLRTDGRPREDRLKGFFKHLSNAQIFGDIMTLEEIASVESAIRLNRSVPQTDHEARSTKRVIDEDTPLTADEVRAAERVIDGAGRIEDLYERGSVYRSLLRELGSKEMDEKVKGLVEDILPNIPLDPTLQEELRWIFDH